MNDDELEGRLRSLGEHPVPSGLDSTHMRAMDEVHPGRGRFGWKAVAIAAFVGFLAGSTALASAGTLPGPAQDVAHDVLGAVGVDVPRSTEGCPDGASYRNHGEYVSEVEAAGGDVEAAAKSNCGKPVKSPGRGHANGRTGDGTPRPDTDGDPCTGPPPWAGSHLSKEARAAAKAERAAQCGADEDPEAEELDTPAEGKREESTTTTAAPTTTTTVATTTTGAAGDDGTETDPAGEDATTTTAETGD